MSLKNAAIMTSPHHVCQCQSQPILTKQDVIVKPVSIDCTNCLNFKPAAYIQTF